MRRMDIQHHTADQVAQYLNTALDICDVAELGPNERVAVLPVLVTLLAGKSVQLAQDVQPLGMHNLGLTGKGAA